MSAAVAPEGALVGAKKKKKNIILSLFQKKSKQKNKNKQQWTESPAAVNNNNTTDRVYIASVAPSRVDIASYESPADAAVNHVHSVKTRRAPSPPSSTPPSAAEVFRGSSVQVHQQQQYDIDVMRSQIDNVEQGHNVSAVGHVATTNIRDDYSGIVDDSSADNTATVQTPASATNAAAATSQSLPCSRSSSHSSGFDELSSTVTESSTVNNVYLATTVIVDGNSTSTAASDSYNTNFAATTTSMSTAQQSTAPTVRTCADNDDDYADSGRVLQSHNFSDTRTNDQPVNADVAARLTAYLKPSRTLAHDDVMYTEPQSSTPKEVVPEATLSTDAVQLSADDAPSVAVVSITASGQTADALQKLRQLSSRITSISVPQQAQQRQQQQQQQQQGRNSHQHVVVKPALNSAYRNLLAGSSNYSPLKQFASNWRQPSLPSTLRCTQSILTSSSRNSDVTDEDSSYQNSDDYLDNNVFRDNRCYSSAFELNYTNDTSSPLRADFNRRVQKAEHRQRQVLNAGGNVSGTDECQLIHSTSNDTLSKPRSLSAQYAELSQTFAKWRQQFQQQQALSTTAHAGANTPPLEVIPEATSPPSHQTNNRPSIVVAAAPNDVITSTSAAMTTNRQGQRLLRRSDSMDSARPRPNSFNAGRYIRSSQLPKTAMAQFNSDGTPKSILKKSCELSRSCTDVDVLSDGLMVLLHGQRTNTRPQYAA